MAGLGGVEAELDGEVAGLVDLPRGRRRVVVGRRDTCRRRTWGRGQGEELVASDDQGIPSVVVVVVGVYGQVPQ